MSLKNSPNVISSPESASGVTLYALPDGLIVDQFGQVRARASLSARQVKELGLLMSGTYGRPSSTSSMSLALQLCLENKLRMLLNGSILCEVIWRPWVTVSGISTFKPRARVRSIYVTEYSLWPTPTAGCGNAGGSKKRLSDERLKINHKNLRSRDILADMRYAGLLTHSEKIPIS